MQNLINKTDMYRLLHNGYLGNTVPMWFNDLDWLWAVDSGERFNYKWWGVRSVVAGGPCFLNISFNDVVARCREIERAGYRFNISPMIDRIVTVTMWANIWESPTGLIVEGIEYPPKEGSWRELMPIQAKRWEGITARSVLRKHLNANSYDDLTILLDTYPNHVVELSATETCFGTDPGRNAIIWEVRNY